MVTRYITEGADAGKGIIDFYVNGSRSIHTISRLCSIWCQCRQVGYSGLAMQTAGTMATVISVASLTIFASTMARYRPTRLERISRGLAAISAGSDFTVTETRRFWPVRSAIKPRARCARVRRYDGMVARFGT